MPAQKPHASEQVVQTPLDLLYAIGHRFGHIQWDLAANADNSVAAVGTDLRYFGPDHKTKGFRDALAPELDWPTNSFNWCNPPFGKLEPWVEKAAAQLERCDVRTLMLLPAGIGSRWFSRFVHRRAHVTALEGRVIFQGHDTPYPKDLILAHYGFGLTGFDVWDWRGYLKGVEAKAAGECVPAANVVEALRGAA